MALIIENLDLGPKDRPILKNISLEHEFSDTLSIIGPSGSGKTTLAKAILGLNDFSIEPVTYGAKGFFSYIPQDLALWPHLSVIETLNKTLVFAKKTHLKPAELLKWCGLINKKDLLPKNLSGGEKQRLALARALLGEPKLVIMDEPFSGLDAVAKADLKRLIVNLRSHLGFGIILITHDLNDCLMTQKTLILYEGKIFWHGPTKELSNKFPAQWDPLKVF